MHSLKKERFKTLSDLHDIYDYIAFNLLASDVARNTTDRILEAVRTLQTMPERNPLYKEEPWHSQGVRFIPVKNYIVFYTVNTDTDTVSIARIMYGARDLSHQPAETNEW